MSSSQPATRRWWSGLLAIPLSGDEEEDRTARILQVILLSLLATSIAISAVSLFIQTYTTIYALSVGCIVLLVSYGLMLRRHHQLASLIVLIAMLSILVYLQYVGEGTHDIAVLAYPLIIAMASLLLGRRGYISITVLSILAHGLVMLAELQGQIDVPFSRDEIVGDFVIASIVLVMAAVMLHLLSDNLRRSLERARLNEYAQLEANRALQAVRDSLEERVVVRTAQLNASVEVSRVVTSVLDPEDLIRQVVQLITDRFDFYYAAVFLLDEFGKYAVLREATGTAGRLLKEGGHQLEIGGQSMVGKAIVDRKPRVAGRVTDEPVRFVNPLLPDTRSEAALPLIVGDRVLGALDVQSTETDVFDDSTLAMLQSLADQIAIALNTARQFHNTQLDARQATALFEASQLAGFISESLESAVEHLLSTVAKHSDFDIWLAASYDVDSARYTLIAAHRGDARVSDGVEMHVDPTTDAPTALAIRLHQPVVINDPDIDPLLNNLSSDERRTYGRSVSVPALLGERVVGAVSLGRAIDKSPIDQRDIQLAQAVASQVAVTIENRRLFDQAQRAVSELDALMRRYTQEGWQKFNRSRPGVVQQEFADPGASPLFPEVMPQVEQAARSGGALPATSDGQAALAIPIALRGQVIGTLGVQAEADRRWTDDEMATLKAVADQVAQSVEVARLLDETEASLQETTALYQASRAMASATTPVEVMHLVVNTLHARLNVNQVDLVLYDGDLGYGTITAQAVPVPGAADGRFPIAGDPCYEVMLAERQPLGISDLAAHPATAHLASDLYRRGVQAVMLAPLMVGQRLIGFVRADATGAPRQFMDNELEFCETLTRQAAVAIENRRLFEETQRRAEIESALNQISQTIKASLDPQAVLDLQSAITEMGRVMQSSRSYYLANDDDLRFVYAYEWCAQNVPPLRGTRQSWMALPETFGRLKDGQSLAINSVQQDDPPELRRLLDAQGVRSHIHVPVLTGNRLIGVLGFDQIDRERRWMAEEVNMVQRIADQLAAALENARLYQNVRSRVNELTALTRIGRRLAATLDLEDVLNTIVEEALNVTPADRGSIALYDSRQDALEVRVLIGYPEKTRQHILEDGYNALRREDGLHGRLLSTGQAVLSNDVQKDAGYAADSDTRSELIVPIRQGDTLLGALNLESPHTYAFSDSDQRLIEALADQAAVAIANARAYESERAALERMREVDRLKTQFLANMSHELRTPLNSIIGFSRVILRGIDGPLTDLQQADLTAIHNSGQHLLGLINDILDLSKIEAGKMELSLEDLDLADVIKGVMSTAIALVKDKKVELHQEVSSDLPPIRADARRIRQVVLNLVSNAAKFTEAGHITARAVVRSNEVQVSVSDTGIGIPEDKLAHIFEEFTQVDASTTRRVGGTGLGLAISRRFVEMHGGRMWVESELDKGSTFTFTLPLEQPGGVEAISPSDELTEPDPDRRRILCIDDDPSVLTLYRRYLEKQGFQVIGLQDSNRALEEARRLQPAAITLDVLMPNRDGWTVLADLKTNPETSSIPIIVCSIIEDESKGFSLGAADYLVKPISERDLMRALDRVNGQRPVKTVLVIDDEADALRLVRRMLELRPGVQVQEAQGGALGIASVQTHRPDVVLLDLMMPDIDGFAVLETIKSNRHSRDIPVIIVTAKELNEEDRTRLQGKAAALLNKGTLDPQTLLSEITAALSRIGGPSSPDLNATQPVPQVESATGR